MDDLLLLLVRELGLAFGVVLGLLVFPSHLGPVVLSGLALAGVLTFVARPIAVWACTAFQGLSTAERSLVAWAGLRGAVPIVLATFALSANVAESDKLFNAVFFVVLVSALLQGPTFEPLARRLGLSTESGPFFEPPIEAGVVRSLGGEMVEFSAEPGDAIVGRPVRDLGLPAEAVVALIVRGDEAIPQRGSTVVATGDRLYLLTRGRADLLEPVIASWRDGDIEP